MKMYQHTNQFQEVAIVFETLNELETFLQIIYHAKTYSDDEYAMIGKIKATIKIEVKNV